MLQRIFEIARPTFRTCIRQRLQRLETLSHSLSLNSVFFLFIPLPRPLACKIMGYTLRLYEAGAKMELRWVEELVEVDPRIRSTLFETSTYEFLLDVQRCSFARHIEIVA